ncbi:MAG: PspC domain-containing protein [Bacteroidota bacterium]|nr:PspC domain-containing protein [Bacteroidota bacterium]
MKKVININFQGRVIPIEETAYDMLTRYVESLRLFFANEEGKDEIINDIEGRIAELFGETLKKGSICITDSDVNTIINSMGRPEDFEADEEKVHSTLGGESRGNYSYQQSNFSGRGKLYRDENHKVLAGVCCGIANYFAIDPVIVRILFVIFIGISLISYLILWIVVPSNSSLQIGSQRKRLFRDTDTKIIGGVCSGLAQYFAVQLWIPRVLFLVPFFSFVFRWGHWGWWDFPHFLSFSFSPGSVFIYIVLWLILPEAKTAADKLEIKGEKVDLNNIKSTIQGDLEGFKDRAQQFGSEMREKAQKFSSSFRTPDSNSGSTQEEINELKSNNFSSSIPVNPKSEPVTKRSRRGLGDFIALIAKIFGYFIIGCFLFSIVVSLFGIGVVFTSLLPAKDYVIRSGWQNLFAWGTLILFVWVPVVGIVTWIIRRITRKRGNSTLIRSTFFALWLGGLLCVIGLVTSMVKDFHYRNNPVDESIVLTNPRVNKLEVKIAPFNRFYHYNWFRLEPFASVDDDTVFARNIRVRLVKSNNDSFQVTMAKLTNGRSKQDAERIASRIKFNIVQNDTMLLLDRGIAITANDKFRNQQVIVTIAVPVGKRIKINEGNAWGSWGNSMSVHLGFNSDNYDSWEDDMETKGYDWRHNVEYIMTAEGLQRVDKSVGENDNNEGDNRNETIEQFRKSKEQMEREKEQKLKELQEIDKELQKTDSAGVDSSRYHYRPSAPPAPRSKRMRVSETSTAAATVPGISDMLMIKFAL